MTIRTKRMLLVLAATVFLLIVLEWTFILSPLRMREAPPYQWPTSRKTTLNQRQRPGNLSMLQELSAAILSSISSRQNYISKERDSYTYVDAEVDNFGNTLQRKLGKERMVVREKTLSKFQNNQRGENLSSQPSRERDTTQNVKRKTVESSFLQSTGESQNGSRIKRNKEEESLSFTEEEDKRNNSTDEDRNDNYVIVVQKRPWFVHSTQVDFRSCPAQYNACTLSYDLRDLQSARAVVFDALGLHGYVAPPRPQGQLWVLFFMEPPPVLERQDRSFASQEWRGVFNLTMSYREDSDIYSPYGFVLPRNGSSELNSIGGIASQRRGGLLLPRNRSDELNSKGEIASQRRGGLLLPRNRSDELNSKGEIASQRRGGLLLPRNRSDELNSNGGIASQRRGGLLLPRNRSGELNSNRGIASQRRSVKSYEKEGGGHDLRLEYSNTETYGVNVWNSLPLSRHPKSEKNPSTTHEPKLDNKNLISPSSQKQKEKTSKTRFSKPFSQREDNVVSSTGVAPLPVSPYFRQVAARKTRGAVWLVSHCEAESSRDQYVQRLRRRLDVAIYGKCSGKYCGTVSECRALINSTFRFVLSFENTFCIDYATEKVFTAYNNLHVIPVVRGGADYSTLLPAGTYVDASDFPSPEALGDYLHSLGKDSETFAAMLEKKDRYRSEGWRWDWTVHWCQLCRLLHTAQHLITAGRVDTYTYPDIAGWISQHTCWPAPDL